jgi:hypothetical protein
MQLIELVQDTLANVLLVKPGFGLGVIDQVTPSHVSTRVAVPDDEYPTATQKVELPQEIEARCPLPGFGLGMTDQVFPFHDSAIDPTMPDEEDPNATQLAELEQETKARLSSVPGLGLGTTDQVLPFHDSIRVPVSCAPTAKQMLDGAQDTPLKPPPATWMGSATDQVLPINVSIGFPNARHRLELAHDTLVRSL